MLSKLTTLGATHVGHNDTSQVQKGLRTCRDNQDLHCYERPITLEQLQ